MQIFDIVYDLLKTAGNGKSATVRYLSEKQIKIRYLFLHTAYKIAVSHCQLIKIAQHSVIEFVHFALSFSTYNKRDYCPSCCFTILYHATGSKNLN